MRRLTALLGRFGLREPVIRLRAAVARVWRQSFERLGSDRFSHPALHEMDTQLDRIIGITGGFYVEAGGFDGFTQSNTYFLERFRGWRGILVEPMPENVAMARRNRPLATVVHCALVGPDHSSGVVEMDFGDLMTSVRGAHDDGWVDAGLALGWRDPRVESVPARTLSAVLDEAGAPPIDLLSLDVEGFETEVLRGLDLDRHPPAWVLVEMHDLAAGREQVSALLGEHYTEHAQLSPLDVLYRRQRTSSTSSSGTARSMSTPAR